jgi:hypothetical protein
MSRSAKSLGFMFGAVLIFGLVYSGFRPACACGPKIPAYQIWIEGISRAVGWPVTFERPGLQ